MPAAKFMEAALAQCGPNLAALLRGDDDPPAPGPPRLGRMANGWRCSPPTRWQRAWPAAAVVPRPLLDAATIAVAARQMFDARTTPELTRAAQDATSVVRSAGGALIA